MQQLTPLLQYGDAGLLILRLALGAVFIVHGWPKIQKAKTLASGMGMSATFVMVLGLVEVLAALGVILDVFVQLSALLMAVVMLGAIKMKILDWKIPFTAHDKTGWEFDLLLLAAAIVILVTGGGNIGV